MNDAAPKIVKLSTATLDALTTMLRAVEDAGETNWFSPHSFSRPYLAKLCAPHVLDLHYVLMVEAEAFAYGLLRGWDEGYEIPSLGIAVHPDHRGVGLGVTMMQFLHAAARLRGCARVRLRVSRSNAVAVALYHATGYRFEEPSAGGGRDVLLTGYKELVR